MLNTLLVGIDDSGSSQWAFEMALKLSKALGAELLLVHVLDIFAPDGAKNPIRLVDSCLSELDEEAQKAYELKINKLVDRYETMLKEKQAEANAARVKARYLQPYGRPGPAICKVADEHNVDLIIVGNRDRSTLKELVPGSVSNYVVHHALCSVTIVHSDSRDKAFAAAKAAGLPLATVL